MSQILSQKATIAASSEKSVQRGIGPLNYLFRSYEAEGAQILSQLDKSLTHHPGSTSDVDRIIHLLPHSEPSPAWQTIQKTVARSKGITPATPEIIQWTAQTNFLNTIWTSEESSDVFWTEKASPDIGRFRYHLPWNLIISDIVTRGGGLIHGGLASWRDQGLLFLAPPGGGKSTTLAVTPADWQVHSDDAALVWPNQNGHWLASPLPSWTRLTSEQPQPVMDLGNRIRVGGIVVLKKSQAISLLPLADASVLPHIYKGLCEYPLTVMSGLTFKRELFQAACQATRALSCWQLCLPRGADIWPQLTELLREEAR